MNHNTKLALLQNQIDNLEKENEHLKQENDFLRQMIPNGTDVQPVKEVYDRLQKALADALILQRQYESANEAIKILKQNYETEVNELLTRLRGDVARAESKRSGTNLR